MHSVLKTFLPTLLLLGFTSVIVRANEKVLIDYEGDTADSFLGPYGASGIAFEGQLQQVFDVVNDPEDATNRVGKFDNYHVADQSNGAGGIVKSWGIISIRPFDNPEDIRNYQTLEFSFYSEGDDPRRTIAIQLRFESPNDRNVWVLRQPYQPFLAEGLNEWKTVSIVLHEAFFSKDPAAAESDLFDLEKLNGVGVLIYNNDSTDFDDEKPVYMDDIKVTDGSAISPYLRIDPPSVNFGNLAASASNFRFSSEIIKLDYFAPTTGDWEIRAYTSNPANTLGLILVDENNSPILDETGVPVSKIPLKINPGAADDEDDDSNWSGDSALFSFVGNISPDSTGENASYSRVAFPFSNQGEPNNSSADIFPVKLAIDIAGAVAGKHSTAVTFELYIAD